MELEGILPTHKTNTLTYYSTEPNFNSLKAPNFLKDESVSRKQYCNFNGSVDWRNQASTISQTQEDLLFNDSDTLSPNEDDVNLNDNLVRRTIYKYNKENRIYNSFEDQLGSPDTPFPENSVKPMAPKSDIIKELNDMNIEKEGQQSFLNNSHPNLCEPSLFNNDIPPMQENLGPQKAQAVEQLKESNVRDEHNLNTMGKQNDCDAISQVPTKHIKSGRKRKTVNDDNLNDGSMNHREQIDETRLSAFRCRIATLSKAVFKLSSKSQNFYRKVDEKCKEKGINKQDIFKYLTTNVRGSKRNSEVTKNDTPRDQAKIANEMDVNRLLKFEEEKDGENLRILKQGASIVYEVLFDEPPFYQEWIQIEYSNHWIKRGKKEANNTRQAFMNHKDEIAAIFKLS